MRLSAAGFSRFHFAPLLAALCLLLPSFCQLVFSIQLSAVKSEQEKILDDPSASVQVLVLDATALQHVQWNGEHELCVGTTHYDVQSVERRGACLVVHVVTDEREDLLSEGLRHTGHDTQPVAGIHFDEVLYDLPAIAFILPHGMVLPYTCILPERHFPSVSLSAPLPPPKSA